MRKLKLLLASLALAVVGGVDSAWAQTWTASSLSAGSFYLQSVGNGMLLSYGHDYGNQATTDWAGLSCTLTKNGENYSIYTGRGTGYLNKGHNGPYVNMGTADWTITAVSGLENTYTIHLASDATYYLHTSDNSTIIQGDALPETANNHYYWKLIAKTERESLASASQANPKDVTYLINNQNFNIHTNEQAYWKTGSDANWVDISNNCTVRGGDVSNYCAEVYNNNFDIYQNLTAPAYGKYKLTCQGFYRAGGQGTTTTTQNAEIYANDDHSPILNIISGASTSSGSGYTKEVGSTGTYVPNGMGNASTVFSAGAYSDNAVETIITSSTSLKIGLRKTTTISTDWTIFDNVRLYYLGTCLVNDAVAFTTGSTTTADMWYYYDIPTTDNYEFTSSAAATLTYATDGTQLTSGATGTEDTFTANQTKTISLNAGRLYFKTSAATTLTVSYKYNVGTATADINYVQGGETVTVTWAGASTNNPGASFAKNGTPSITFNGSAVEVTTIDKGFSFTVPTGLAAGTAYTLTIPANAFGYAAGSTYNEAQNITLNTPAVLDGTYYLYNSYTGLFLGRGNAEGTASVVDKYGIPCNLVTGSDGISTVQFVDNSRYLSGTYWLNAFGGTGDRFSISTQTVGDYTGYALYNQNLSNNNRMYVYVKGDGNDYRVAGNAIIGDNCTNAEQTVWLFKTVAEHNTIVNAYPTDNINHVISAAGVTEAVEAAGSFTDYLATLSSQDMTSVIGTATFDSDAGDWTWTVVKGESGWPQYTDTYARIYAATGTYTQTIDKANLPAGIYKVKMAGFDRRSNNDVDNAMAASYGSVNSSYLKANDEQVRITPWKTMFDAAGQADSWEGQAASMNGGYADNVLYIYLDGNTDLTLTVAKPNHCNASYMCFGNFTMTRYYDPVAVNKLNIQNNKGDITSLINGDFQTDATGWNGGSLVTWVGTQGWRGGSGNNYYEANTSTTMYYTVPYMPAGTYKVVAAARAYEGGKLKAQVAGGEYSAELTGVGNAASEGRSEINTNGVEMPYSSLGGFTTDGSGHNWKWISATGTLASNGNLVINFVTTGTSWMAIDDVHLYCTSLDGTSYAKTLPTISGNTDLSSYADGSVITCDITVSNPNAMMYSGNGNDITTAAGTSLNNFMFKKSGFGGTYWAANVVLYDGYAYSSPENEKGLYFDNARLYRTFPADQWCTLVLPFWPNDANFTKMYPSELSDAGVLTFSEATNSTWDTNDKPMLVKSSSAVNVITGGRKGTGFAGTASGNMTSGEGVNMNGTYSAISAVPEGSYIVARVSDADALYKVNSIVSLAPFRAYFSIPAESGEVKANVIALNFGDLPTTIEEIPGVELTVKDAAIYNLAGQRLNDSQFTIHNSQLKRGIYIVGGKKVLVK